MKHCPNCGHPVKPTDTFCQNCGFDLSSFRSKMKAGPQQANNNSQNGFNSEPNRPVNPNFQRPVPNPYPPKRHNVFGFIIVAIAVIFLGFGGMYTYSNHMAPFSWFTSSNSSSSSSNGSSSDTDSSSTGSSDETTSTPSKSTAYDQITSVWNHINSALDSDDSNGGSTDFAQDFSGGTGNNSYQGLHDWKNEVKGADDHNNTEVISITPYDLHMSRQGSKSVVTYKVKYNFKLHADSDHSHNHIQVFNWTATFDNSSKIAKMTSPKTPAKDYDE